MTAWLMTYLVHSSILIALVALITRFIKNEWLAFEENLWRVALLGGLVTASLQVGSPVEPLGDAWAIGSAPAEAELLPTALEVAPAISSTLQASSPSLPSLPSTLMVVWMVGGLLLTLGLGLGYLQLERRLRGRRLIDRGPLNDLLEELLDKTDSRLPVALSTSSRIEVPLAKGWCWREICLPERVEAELSRDQQETILAHELAHLRRHDPRWLTLFRLIETVFFFQPLNRFARRRVQELAEYQCDDWAVERTGRPATMARCLANVAEWSIHPDQGLPAPALTSRGRGLKRRVRRLLDRPHPLPHQPRPTWLLPVLTVLLLLTALAVPGFSIAESGDKPTPPLAPEPPAMSEVAPEPAPVVTPPVAPVQPIRPVATPPVEPVQPIRPIEAHRHELEIRRQALISELQEIEAVLEVEAQALAARAQDLERTLEAKLEAVERIPRVELEALERELQSRVQLQKHQIEKIEFMHQHLQETVERQRALREAELHQLREEQQQRLQELHERQQEDRQDP